jgi:DNA primase
VLYHLPEVLEAKEKKRAIFLVEGEKDVDNLRALGFVATTNPGGAKKWLNQYTDTLAGADVIVWPDNDKTGNEHRDLVCEKLHGFVATLRIMESPDPHKDASDWILKGGATADDIKARALEARMYVAPEIDQRQRRRRATTTIDRRAGAARRREADGSSRSPISGTRNAWSPPRRDIHYVPSGRAGWCGTAAAGSATRRTRSSAARRTRSAAIPEEAKTTLMKRRGAREAPQLREEVRVERVDQQHDLARAPSRASPSAPSSSMRIHGCST